MESASIHYNKVYFIIVKFPFVLRVFLTVWINTTQSSKFQSCSFLDLLIDFKVMTLRANIFYLYLFLVTFIEGILLVLELLNKKEGKSKHWLLAIFCKCEYRFVLIICFDLSVSSCTHIYKHANI